MPLIQWGEESEKKGSLPPVRAYNRPSKKGGPMSVARKTVVVASSKESFHDAVNQAISRASKTLRGITGLEVTSQKAKIENGRILEYRIECAITFLLDE
jgi:Uncharacterized conserved protein